ncbi:MAG TPA: 30S ribosomal protein S16 [Polyangiaceae bacterium]
MITVRLARVGTSKTPLYRIVVTNSRAKRDGRHLENIGTYDPTREPAQFQIDHERFTYWRSKGAQPSQTLDQLVRRQAKNVAAEAAAAAAK